MLGYWGKPPETAAALREHWVHTGDAGWMDTDGYLYVVDRIKDMIVAGGENVYSTEVENAVAQHPAAANCTVVGVPTSSGRTAHAVMVRKPAAELTGQDIREHAKNDRRLQSACTVEFVNALPATPTGKVLKRELRATYRADADRGVN
jgi:acyl-CoA synthetase (AMP-forming)/AMP-acid ligase II